MPKFKSLCRAFIMLVVVAWTASASAQSNLAVYGYFATRYEKTFSEPGLDGGITVKETAPGEFSYPFLNVMLQHQINERFRVFVNLNGSGGGTIELRNFWGEYSASRYLNLRLGKIYRRFGLYNEILDAVPTYFGIEPPELFDADHLMISRTTTFMLFGSVKAGRGVVNYSVATDNGEGEPLNGPAKNTFPLGFDLNYKFGQGNYTLGTSLYTTGGETMPNVEVGGGSPKSGVLPWMAEDKFTVWGGYLEGRFGNLTVQTEYWQSPHKVKRDPASIVTIIQGTDLNASQLARFLNNPTDPVTEANVRTRDEYDAKTWYIRSGYSVETKIGEIAPYVQWDWYSSPEIIAKKKYGGDNEAGVADDGIFNKSTVGIVFRPIPEVAVKLDQSFHFYKFNGENVNYPEIRFDVSYIFGQ